MATVSSDTGKFDLTSDGARDAVEFVHGLAKAHIGKTDLDLSGYVLEITVELVKNGRKRVGSIIGQEIYDMEVSKVVASGKKAVWVDNKLRANFNFEDETFVWKGRAIYLAASEKITMFRLLVLKEYPTPGMMGAARAAVRRLRGRFGPEFPGVPKR